MNKRLNDILAYLCFYEIKDIGKLDRLTIHEIILKLLESVIAKCTLC